MNVTERIDEILQERGMSRRQLAIAADIPTSSFQAAMARGKNMTVEMLLAVSDTLDVPVTEFLGASPEQGEKEEIPDPNRVRLRAAYGRLNKAGQQAVLKYAEEMRWVPSYKRAEKKNKVEKLLSKSEEGYLTAAEKKEIARCETEQDARKNLLQAAEDSGHPYPPEDKEKMEQDILCLGAERARILSDARIRQITEGTQPPAEGKK